MTGDLRAKILYTHNRNNTSKKFFIFAKQATWGGSVMSTLSVNLDEDKQNKNGDESSRSSELIFSWRHNASLAREAHFNSANYYGKLHHWFGIPVVILTTLVGTGVFTTLQESNDVNWRIATSILGVLAAILAGLQTFFNYQGISENHRTIANRYSALIKELEYQHIKSKDYEALMKFLDEWRVKYDTTQQESPSVPEAIWRSTLKKFNRQKS